MNNRWRHIRPNYFFKTKTLWHLDDLLLYLNMSFRGHVWVYMANIYPFMHDKETISWAHVVVSAAFHTWYFDIHFPSQDQDGGSVLE